MKKYKLIVMSFDGDYNYSNDLGSKWYFYPFHFVTTSSGKTVIEGGQFMNHLEGLRVKTVSKHFKEVSERPDMEGANLEEFMFAV
jgi:hypothetical protein